MKFGFVDELRVMLDMFGLPRLLYNELGKRVSTKDKGEKQNTKAPYVNGKGVRLALEHLGWDVAT